MNELLDIVLMSLTGALFALGGTEIPMFKRGFKWIRRILLPVLLSIVAYYDGLKDSEKGKLKWWQVVLFLLLSVFLRSGYGDSSPYWKKILVFTAYGLPSLVLGFSWWVVITPIVLTLLFMASNWKPLAKTVFWKSWEFLAGVLIYLCYRGAMLNRW